MKKRVFYPKGLGKGPEIIGISYASFMSLPMVMCFAIPFCSEPHHLLAFIVPYYFAIFMIERTLPRSFLFFWWKRRVFVGVDELNQRKSGELRRVFL